MSAIISECGQYRYVLRRSIKSVLRWHKPMLFVMLNPSTADAEKDDPTIRRCKFFAEREGATELVVVNLFALRSTDPHQLKMHPSPVGPDNDEFISKAIAECWNMPVIAAWGAHQFAKARVKEITLLNDDFYCLGKTKNGSPRHPLYLKNTAKIERIDICPKD